MNKNVLTILLYLCIACLCSQEQERFHLQNIIIEKRSDQESMDKLFEWLEEEQNAQEIFIEFFQSHKQEIFVFFDINLQKYNLLPFVTCLGEEGLEWLNTRLLIAPVYRKRDMINAISHSNYRKAIPNLLYILEEEKSLGIKACAAKALGELQAEEAIPLLIKSVGIGSRYYENTSGAAQDALLKIGKKSIPAIIEALEDSKYNSKYELLSVLRGMRAGIADIIPKLIILYEREKDVYTKREILSTLAVVEFKNTLVMQLFEKEIYSDEILIVEHIKFLGYEKLKPIEFFLRNTEVELDGIAYPYFFQVDGKDVEEHQINISKNNERIFCTIKISPHANCFRIFGGYIFKEITIEKFMQGMTITRLDKICVSKLIQHLGFVVKQNNNKYSASIEVIENILKNYSKRKMLKFLSHKEMKKLILFLQSWPLNSEQNLQMSVILSKINTIHQIRTENK